jgi:hypothetical protein
MSKYISHQSNEMEEWATNTLSTEELSQYRAAAKANSDLWQSYRTQGLYTVQETYETVHSIDLAANIEVLKSQKIVMQPGVDLFSLELDSNFKSWMHRFQSETGTIISMVQVE